MTKMIFELPDSIESRIRNESKRLGIGMKDYVIKLVEERAASMERAEKAEAALYLTVGLFGCFLIPSGSVPPELKDEFRKFQEQMLPFIAPMLRSLRENPRTIEVIRRHDLAQLWGKVMGDILGRTD
jgi:hypothetical protein